MLSTVQFQFMQYVANHGKNYATVEEFNTRMSLYTETHQVIEQANARNSSYTAGFNQFSDWTTEEYEVMLGLKNIAGRDDDASHVFTGVANSTGKDWRDVSGVVTPVKDQGQCGSCWAFSATESVESAYVIAGNEQVIMAPQELVDCSKGLFSNHGCSGGWYYYAWKWLATHKSMTEADYPYTSGATGEETTCAYDEAKGVTFVSSYVQVAQDTDSINAAIEIGPVSVAVSAGNDVFRNYSSGIVTEADGCPTNVDHAIQAVGFGYEGSQGYYIVRNSWNTTWGDQGFIKLGMASGAGVCGVNQDVYYPVI